MISNDIFDGYHSKIEGLVRNCEISKGFVLLAGKNIRANFLKGLYGFLAQTSY